MIIDAHAHLVAPEVFYAYKARLQASSGHHRGNPGISDEMLAASADRNVALMDEVGTDLQLISPRPFQLMTSTQPERIVRYWVEANNDLIARTVEMHPTRFAGVCALALADGQPVEACFEELERNAERGFVGVLLNPDPSERGTSPALGEEYWFPLYDKLQQLRMPALIHSAGCFNGRETYSGHFITEESIAILSLLDSPVLTDFPELAIIVAHGGGSVPYQIGRWQAERLIPSLGGSPDGERFEVSLRRLWFDTVLHNPPSLALLFDTVGTDRVVFGTERPGSGSAVDPRTGRQMDDLKRVIDELPGLTDDDRGLVYEQNSRSIFTRLKA